MLIEVSRASQSCLTEVERGLTVRQLPPNYLISLR